MVPPAMYSIPLQRTMITCSNSLARKGGRAPNHEVEDELHPSGLASTPCMRTGSAELSVGEFALPHPPQPYGQPAGHSNGGDGTILSHRQPAIAAPQLGFLPRRTMGRFHQQTTQQGIALLADMSQTLFVPRAVF